MRKLKRMIRPFQAKQSQDKILIDYHSSVNVLSVNIILTGTQWINTLTALFTRLTAANHKQSLPHSYKKKKKKKNFKGKLLDSYSTNHNTAMRERVEPLEGVHTTTAAAFTVTGSYNYARKFTFPLQNL